METVTVAATILEQLGGRRFMTMTGANKLMSDGKTLSFRLPSRFATGGINSVRVTLDESDTYTVVFGKVWGMKYNVLKTVSGVYNADLQRVFTAETGLDAKL